MASKRVLEKGTAVLMSAAMAAGMLGIVSSLPVYATSAKPVTTVTATGDTAVADLDL